MPTIFDTHQMGTFTLRNRMVMAPMTRGRATVDSVPTPRMATYYGQRATAGLIVTEGTFISRQAVGWNRAPGVWTDAMVAAWRPITEAVHAAGGRIFLQLWHMGRVTHPEFQDGEQPVGPSAITAAGESHTPSGTRPYVEPRALRTDELPGIVDDYVLAAHNAIAAGFDGVELHGANGYLLDQFIRSGSNQRTDAYGGSIANRWRFPLEVAAAVAEAVGPERTAIRISPTGTYNGMSDEDPVATYAYGAQELSKLGLLYLHVVEAVAGMMHNPHGPAVLPAVREAFSGTVIVNGGFGADTANAVIGEGRADMVAFGVPFLANPDLVERLRIGAELNGPRFDRFYTGDDDGYIDYPVLAGSAEQVGGAR